MYSTYKRLHTSPGRWAMECQIWQPWLILLSHYSFNTLKPGQDGRHFADDIFKWIFLNEFIWISIKVSLKFVPRGPINNNPALVQIMAWRRPGDKPLSEPMVVSLPTHICIARPQWVKPLDSPFHSVQYICIIAKEFLGIKQKFWKFSNISS